MLILTTILLVFIIALLFIVYKLLKKIEQLKIKCALLTQIIKFGDTENEKTDTLQ